MMQGNEALIEVGQNLDSISREVGLGGIENVESTLRKISKERQDVTMQRSLMALDWLVRTCLPAWLKMDPDGVPYAEQLEALPKVEEASLKTVIQEGKLVQGALAQRIQDFAEATDTSLDQLEPPQGVAEEIMRRTMAKTILRFVERCGDDLVKEAGVQAYQTAAQAINAAARHTAVDIIMQAIPANTWSLAAQAVGIAGIRADPHGISKIVQGNGQTITSDLVANAVNALPMNEGFKQFRLTIAVLQNTAMILFGRMTAAVQS